MHRVKFIRNEEINTLAIVDFVNYQLQNLHSRPFLSYCVLIRDDSPVSRVKRDQRVHLPICGMPSKVAPNSYLDG